MIRPPPGSTLFPYPPLSRSPRSRASSSSRAFWPLAAQPASVVVRLLGGHVLGRRRFSVGRAVGARRRRAAVDRKSTRLNSSHAHISYAVFCLKKKTTLRSYP